MPASAEQKARARGGIKGYRTVTLKNGKTILVAVVPKAGPRGGHTVVLGGRVNITAAARKKAAQIVPEELPATRKVMREDIVDARKRQNAKLVSAAPASSKPNKPAPSNTAQAKAIRKRLRKRLRRR